MKTMRSILFFAVLLIPASLFAGNLQATFHYAVFNTPEQGPYIETYMTIIGNTAAFKEIKPGIYQSSIEITMLFKQEGNISSFKKYVLSSPEITDSLFHPNFIDQQRVSIPNGIYNLELLVRDMNDNDTTGFVFNDIISVNINKSEVVFSGVQLIEKFYKTETESVLSKNGYDLIPYVSNFYPQNINSLIFYCEVYNLEAVMGTDSNVLIRYFIENNDNQLALFNFNSFKKQKTANINIIFAQFDINELASGNYNLVIEVRDRENNLIKSTKAFFQRSNPSADMSLEDISSVNINGTFVTSMTNIDTLKEYINCLRPIADDAEKKYIDNQLQSKSPEYMRQFFYSFWYRRNSTNPEAEWKYYEKQVKMVNVLYSSKIMKGYESERGRIYLQYGAPNNVVESKHEPSAYPYEIWQYYQISNDYVKQSNVKFVFYNPMLAGDDYVLLHSNLRGEINEPNWERMLSKRNNGLYNPDASQSDEQFGGRAGELFNE
ncbi:MAG: GWxTD domain-containing protein [Bacteroidota bacterium]